MVAKPARDVGAKPGDGGSSSGSGASSSGYLYNGGALSKENVGVTRSRPTENTAVESVTAIGGGAPAAAARPSLLRGPARARTSRAISNSTCHRPNRHSTG